MGESTIGIKVADGSYFPVLERGFTGRKRLVLTTAMDNQPRVQIDLYRGNASTIAQARYIGSLIIENIPAAAKGEPEIELMVGIDGEGRLSAEASDMSTGESQRFATSLAALPEAEVAGEPVLVRSDEGTESFEEPSLTGEDYSARAQSRTEFTTRRTTERVTERRQRKRPSLLLLIVIIVLSVLVVVAAAYIVYRSIQGPQAAPVLAPAATAQQPAVAAKQPEPAAAPAPKPAPAKSADVSYLIKRGDTLWDLAATYYRNPWLYPRLAKANGIKNPDLIFAGTRITIPAN